jgi:hypothetical protein
MSGDNTRHQDPLRKENEDVLSGRNEGNLKISIDCILILLPFLDSSEFRPYYPAIWVLISRCTPLSLQVNATAIYF